MTEHPFATLLRKLDAEASKAPWEAVRKSVRVAGTGDSTGAPNGYGGGVCNCLGAGYGLSAGDEQNVRARANARAIVTLRNAAPEVAALVEAGESVVTAYDALVGGKPMPSYGSIDALRAALDALARAARDATSGPADPTRIDTDTKEADRG